MKKHEKKHRHLGECKNRTSIKLHSTQTREIVLPEKSELGKIEHNRVVVMSTLKPYESWRMMNHTARGVHRDLQTLISVILVLCTIVNI